VLPNILGFTVGGFAIVLALGAGDFGEALSSARKPDEDVLESGLAKLSAAFCHFILVQFIALVMAISALAFAKTPPPSWALWLSGNVVQRMFWGVGWFVGIYSLTLAISTAHWIFSSVKLLVRFHKFKAKARAARQAAQSVPVSTSTTGTAPTSP
jgi:hypothetical protein